MNKLQEKGNTCIVMALGIAIIAMSLLRLRPDNMFNHPPRVQPSILKIDSAVLREHDSAVGAYGSCDTCENGIHIPDTAREGGGL